MEEGLITIILCHDKIKEAIILKSATEIPPNSTSVMSLIVSLP